MGGWLATWVDEQIDGRWMDTGMNRRMVGWIQGKDRWVDGLLTSEWLTGYVTGWLNEWKTDSLTGWKGRCVD